MSTASGGGDADLGDARGADACRVGDDVRVTGRRDHSNTEALSKQDHGLDGVRSTDNDDLSGGKDHAFNNEHTQVVASTACVLYSQPRRIKYPCGITNFVCRPDGCGAAITPHGVITWTMPSLDVHGTADAPPNADEAKDPTIPIVKPMKSLSHITVVSIACGLSHTVCASSAGRGRIPFCSDCGWTCALTHSRPYSFSCLYTINSLFSVWLGGKRLWAAGTSASSSCGGLSKHGCNSSQ